MKRKKITKKQSTRPRASDYMTGAEARLHLAEQFANWNAELAAAAQARADEAETRSYPPRGGAPPLSAETIDQIRSMLRDLRLSQPGAVISKLYAFVADRCHVSVGSVRNYDPNPPPRRKNRPRRR